MSSGKVPHISVLFQLKLDYLEIIAFTSPIKVAPIQAHRHETNLRLCDYTNGNENLI